MSKITVIDERKLPVLTKKELIKLKNYMDKLLTVKIIYKPDVKYEG